MVEAYKKFFKNYVNFSGRATRSDYWYVILANFLIGIILGFLPAKLAIVGSVYALVILIPGLSLFVRRMHDINKSGWNWFWCLVPLVGFIILLVFLCTASVNENNKYGALEE